MATRTRPERAALAFSALTATDAERIAKSLSYVERSNLRETLTEVRDASDDERQDALRALVEAVKAPIAFPHPAPHDETVCVFRAIEQFFPKHVAAQLGRLAGSDRVIVAVALCHFTPEYRDEVWEALPTATRATTLGLLATVPTITEIRTRRYARELGERVGLGSRAIR